MKVAREARMHAQQTIDTREAELREARTQLDALQGQLGHALERQLAMHGVGQVA